MHLVAPGTDEPADSTLVGPGMVADVSFSGVSTEYLVDVPGCGRLSVFSQNLGAGPGAAPGDEVRLAWSPRHAFALHGDADAAEVARAAAAAGIGAEAEVVGRRRAVTAALTTATAETGAPPPLRRGRVGSPGCCSRPAWPTWCCSSSPRSPSCC